MVRASHPAALFAAPMAVGAALLISFVGVRAAEQDSWAPEVVSAAAKANGLVVHVGCTDGKRTVKLASKGVLVQGLDTSPQNVQAARIFIHDRGLYGAVSIDQMTSGELPYVENLVSLLVVEDADTVTEKEMLRVLAPGGVAFVKQVGAWKKTVKPVPADIDEWSHYLHDAGGNAVAADLQVGQPERIRWVADPLWSRSHEFNPSINGLVSAGGRMFYILDDGIPGLPDLRFPARWSLYARDAYSGVFLWKRPVPNWGYREWQTRGMWSAPLTLNRRVVTDGKRVFVTLGYRAPVTVLDAASGEEIRTVDNSNGTDEMVLCDGVLLACVREQLSVATKPGPNAQPKRRLNPHEWTIGAPGPAEIVAIDARTGSEMWRLDPQQVVVLTLAAQGSRICFHNGTEIVCLDLKTGQRQWATPVRPARGSRHSGGTLVMHDGVVLYTSADGLNAYSAQDGQQLWTSPKVSGPGISHPPDLFVADNLVWGGDTPGMHSRDRTVVKREGRDPKTGEVKRTIEVEQLFSPLHHVRCYRSKATDRYLMLTKRGVELLDLKDGEHMRNDWLRAMCHYGFMPCNGVLYVPPHHCFCYPGVKMKGFLALASEESAKDKVQRTKKEERLEKGPAYAELATRNSELGTGDAEHPSSKNPHSAFRIPHSPDWPTYRGDPWRSGHAKTAVSVELKDLWQAKLGGKVSPPAIAGGKVFVAQVDANRVCCLDAQSGRGEWTFTAGARVDAPPTIHEGLVLFGCRDGWVYCLRAADGELAWRFRAAPDERRIVAFEQVESVWPVPGNVLVLDGVAYCSAGRSSFLDGGVHLYGLNPQTGAVLYHTCVTGPWPDVHKEKGRPFDMEGVKSDILVTDGTHIFLFQMAFDKELNDVTPARASTLGDRIMGRHLIATGGFLEDVWYDRTFWSYSNRWPGFYYANAAPKAGQILVFDDTTTYGLHVFTERLRLSPAFTPGKNGYELFADDNDNEPILAPSSKDREKGPGFSRAAPPLWSKQIPVRAMGMVLAGDKLVLAGPPDVVPEDDPYASFDGRLGAKLWVVAAANGERLAELTLPTSPVFDGMAAAGGRLFIVCQDGNVLCME